MNGMCLNLVVAYHPQMVEVNGILYYLMTYNKVI